MSTFDATDLQRLQDANEEIKAFGEFLKDRLITLMIIMGKPVPRLQTLSVPSPVTPQVDHRGDPVEPKFHIRECLGGDRFGVDYREHYLPIDYALGGDAADEAMRKTVEDYKRLEAMLPR